MTMKATPISHSRGIGSPSDQRMLIHDWDQLVQLIHENHPNQTVKLEGLRSSFPALVFDCKKTADVRYALKFARQQRLPVVVRDGGLNNFSYPGKESVVVDLRNWNQCVFLNSPRKVSIQAGCTRMEILEKSYYKGWRVPESLFIYMPSQSLSFRGYNLPLEDLISVLSISFDGHLNVWDRQSIMNVSNSGFSSKHLGIILSVDYEW